MKRSELEQFLKENGYYFLRDSKHCIWSNGVRSIPIPHQRVINVFLAKKIMKTVTTGISINVVYNEQKAA